MLQRFAVAISFFGIVFFLIQLDPPLNRENSPFFKGKPTFRLVSGKSGINIKVQNLQS